MWLGRHVRLNNVVSVMEINGLIVKVIFDKNPERAFYVQESYPLDWMYPLSSASDHENQSPASSHHGGRHCQR